jgi:raffinose/stachyose/melibiose transport system substrate-binding protein
MVTTLSQIAELQANGCFQEDPLGTRNETLAATFAQGEAGMLATGSYAMAQINAIAPDLEMGLLAPITVPADEAVWEGIRTTTFMLGVNAESENPEAAMAFLEFLTRPENASTYANGTGQLLTLTDVEYETEELQAQTEWIDRETRFQPRFTITKGEINTGLITAVEDVLSGVPPEEAAATFQATVDRVIAAG